MVKKVLFIGSKNLGLRVLEKIYTLAPKILSAVVTFDDQSDSRTVLKELKRFCQSQKIDFFVLDKPSKLKKIILKIRPDLCIIVGWYWRIQGDVLKLTPGSFIGVHGSLLPKYRGFCPLVWAMINGEKKTGVSLFYFTDNIDEGAIIAQEQFKISDEDTIQNLLIKAEKSAIKIFDKNYMLLIDNKSSKIQQKKSSMSYGSRRIPQDGLINWRDGPRNIYNFIRAQTRPYPGAFTYNGKNQKVYIWKAKPFNVKLHGMPGQVCIIDNRAIVACLGGGIILEEIQIDKKIINKPEKVLKFDERFKEHNQNL